MSTPSGYQPQWQPSPEFQPPTQAFKPYIPPKEKRGTTTCLIVGGILGGVFAMLLAACIFSVYLFFHNQKIQTAAGPNAPPTTPGKSILDKQRRANEPPADVTAAIDDLEDKDGNRRNIALKWLRDQDLEPVQQKKVSRAIVIAMRNPLHSPENEIAMNLLAKWGDASIAPELAASLAEFDSMTADKLDLLAKYKDPATAAKIAALLESRNHGEKARDTLRALGPEAADEVTKYLVSNKGDARTHARSLLRDFNIDFNATEVRMLLDILKGNSFNRFDAAEELAKLPVVPELQSEVSQVLISLFAKKDFLDGGKTIAALSVWADESCLQPLLRMISEEKVSGSDMPKVLPLVGRLGGEAQIPLLMKHFDHPSRGTAVANTLIEIGPACQEEVVKFFNSDYPPTLTNARRVMAAFDDNDTMIVEQCVKDLDSTEWTVQENAIKWLAQCDVVPELSTQVMAGLERRQKSRNQFAPNIVSQAMTRWKNSK